MRITPKRMTTLTYDCQPLNPKDLFLRQNRPLKYYHKCEHKACAHPPTVVIRLHDGKGPVIRYFCFRHSLKIKAIKTFLERISKL